MEGTFDLKAEDVIFGLDNPNNDSFIDSINYSLLVAKMFIRNCKQENQEPELYDYLKFIKNKLDIELIYYRLEQCREHTLEKWTLLYEVL